MVHSPNQPDKKGSRGVLMCEPVNVELDEGLAIMMGSNHGAPTMMGNQSMMEGHHASSQYHDNSSAESMKKKRNRNDKGVAVAIDAERYVPLLTESLAKLNMYII